MSNPTHKRRRPRPSNDQTNNSDEITIPRLEAGLDRVALAIVRAGKRGEVYLPIFERLESEIEILKKKEAMMERAPRPRCTHHAERLIPTRVRRRWPNDPSDKACRMSIECDDVITSADWERCLDRLALVMHRAGKKADVYLPIWERLESEIATAKAKEARMECAGVRAARFMQERSIKK